MMYICMYCGRFFSFSWMLGLFANGIKASQANDFLLYLWSLSVGCWAFADGFWLRFDFLVVAGCWFNSSCLFIAVSWFSVAVCWSLFWSLLEFWLLVAAVCNLSVKFWLHSVCFSLLHVGFPFLPDGYLLQSYFDGSKLLSVVCGFWPLFVAA